MLHGLKYKYGFLFLIYYSDAKKRCNAKTVICREQYVKDRHNSTEEEFYTLSINAMMVLC